jgi:soluble lytic murein transglycosylase
MGIPGRPGARLAARRLCRPAVPHFARLRLAARRLCRLACVGLAVLAPAAVHPLVGSEEDARALRPGAALRLALDAQTRGETQPALDLLAAYEAALAAGVSDRKEGDRIRRKRAQALFRLRRYPEAVAAFASFPGRAPDRIERARALARAGDVPGGVRALEEIAAGPRGSAAAEARLLAALLLDGEGEHARARRHYGELVRRAPRSAAGVTARWQLGWDAYRSGRYAEAVQHFERLAPFEPDELSRLRARYWRARAAARAGEPGAAQEFARIALAYPLSYYGWRARERLDGARPLPDSALRSPSARCAPASPACGGTDGAAGLRQPAGGAAAADEAVPDGPEIPRGSAALAPRELARPRILLEAGLGAEARDELDRLFARARGLEDRLALAELYADAGDFHRPQRLVVDAYQETLARPPVPDSLDLWWHAWPAPFGDEVRDATARRAQVDPALVYAIMREESGYRPEVLSVNGARGLLQLMPETAEKLARGEALPTFAADDLFLPKINIALGSAYLEDLLARFHGRASAAIGSYNAGPQRVAQWLDASELEDDEWVEAIPFDQTRGYVKRVLRSLHAYRVLY